MRQPILIAMTLLMLVLSVAATPRPLKQAKIKRGDLNDRDDEYKKHKPSKIHTTTTEHYPPPYTTGYYH